jgi:nicotinate-nucleotide adenylyltransferase
MTSRRVGILGGMFDPIHNGHLDVIAAAQAALQLDEIFVVPANVPPHRAAPVASSYHRFAMVALALAGREECRATDLELREAGPSYTSDTLRRFQSQGFDPADLFFIIGADAFLEIATWKNYPALLELSHFAVISRSGVSVGELPVRLPSLASRMRREFTATSSPLIFLINAPTADVSSTAIRRARANGESITGMVPSQVQQHIERHALYEDPAQRATFNARSTDRPAGRLHGRD